MNCPDRGRWRAWLDRRPAEREPELAAHLGTCSTCEVVAAEVEQDAKLAARAIGGLAPSVMPPAMTALARERFEQRRAARASRRLSGWLPGPRWRVAASGLAAALALSIAAVSPQGQAAAGEFLAQFRSERFTVIAIDKDQIQRPLAGLEKLGTLKSDREQRRAVQVSSLSEASQKLGFTVVEPDRSSLPTALRVSPKISVLPGQEVRFTFDRAQAEAYYQSMGRKNVDLPEKFDGASLVVNMPAAAVLTYSGPGEESGLIIGQSGEVTAGVDGTASLDEMRDFLLSLPEVSPETARQLRAIKDWRTTLPIPVQAERVNWQETRVGGGQALLLADNSGLGSALIFQKDGRIFGLAGPMKSAELVKIAESLQ